MDPFVRKITADDFHSSDLDFTAFMEALQSSSRPIDEFIINELGLLKENFGAINMDEILKNLSKLVDSQIFHAEVEWPELTLAPEVRHVLMEIDGAHSTGRTLDKKLYRIANKGLLEALYPKAFYRLREFPRFTAEALLRAEATLTPRPPLFGEPITGRLENLSAGGLSLRLTKRIPKHQKFILKVKFPDRTQFESDVEIRHAHASKGEYLHGFKFLTMPQFMGKKINKMAQDYLGCEYRIHEKIQPICDPACAFYNLCSKPQKAK